ncbi:MAG: hypothetical protein IPP36_10950 [Nitrosomonadales bacterium]|nr:hypothetical protein [Nitrosomonadales bacterium]
MVEQDKNPGYPFWVAGIDSTVGSRPTTPPLDMTSIPGIVDGWDGGLPRHALAGYSAGGVASGELTRFTAEKHIEVAKPVYYDEKGTPMEKVAMAFHADRTHPSSKIDKSGNETPAYFSPMVKKPIQARPITTHAWTIRASCLQRVAMASFLAALQVNFST